MFLFIITKLYIYWIDWVQTLSAHFTVNLAYVWLFRFMEKIGFDLENLQILQLMLSHFNLTTTRNIYVTARERGWYFHVVKDTFVFFNYVHVQTV